jgi:hypothetical protein
MTVSARHSNVLWSVDLKHASSAPEEVFRVVVERPYLGANPDSKPGPGLWYCTFSVPPFVTKPITLSAPDELSLLQDVFTYVRRRLQESNLETELLTLDGRPYIWLTEPEGS